MNVQGVLEPGSGQEVLLTIWINGGLKGTAQLAALKQVPTALPAAFPFTVVPSFMCLCLVLRTLLHPSSNS